MKPDTSSCIVEHQLIVPAELARPQFKGKVQQAIYKTLLNASEFGEKKYSVQDIVRRAEQDLTPPDQGKKDRRSEVIRRALRDMVARGVLHQESGFIWLPTIHN